MRTRTMKKKEKIKNCHHLRANTTSLFLMVDRSLVSCMHHQRKKLVALAAESTIMQKMLLGKVCYHTSGRDTERHPLSSAHLLEHPGHACSNGTSTAQYDFCACCSACVCQCCCILVGFITEMSFLLDPMCT